MIKLQVHNIIQFIKFGIVGSSGAVINLLVYQFCVYIEGSYTVASIISFIVAVTINYMINHLWTFQIETKGIKLSFFKYIQYVSVNLVGLAINLLILNLIILIFGKEFNLHGQALGIIAGMGFNYLFSKLLVFKKEKVGE